MKHAPLNQNAILNALRGQTLCIPSLTPLFRTWPAPQPNPHYRSAVPLVDQAIDRIAATQPLIAKRKRDDIALLTALWYPHADQHVLQTLAWFAVWVVCWDDCVDANEGDLAGDFDKAERWRFKSLEGSRESLRLDDTGSNGQVDAINAIFKDFGNSFYQCPKPQRQRLYDEVQFFIKCCSTEQKLQLERFIPDYDSYMSFRLGTIGGRMLCALVEHATSDELPPLIADSVYRVEIWNQVCILLTLLNDMLSLKKELASDCVINAVSALLSLEKDLAAVIGDLKGKMREAVEKFDRAAESLLKLVKDDAEQTGVVRRHIDGCRAIVTGTLEFT